MTATIEQLPPDYTAPTLAEVPVAAPIINPDTGCQSRRFSFFGVVDLVEGSVLVDWKTVGDPDRHIAEKAIGYQLDAYALALEHHGRNVTRAEFRIVTRPSIRLKAKQTPEEYEAECVAWLAQPGRVVADELWFNPARLESARIALWNVTQNLLERRRSGRWMKNEHACFRYGSPCEFLPLCRAQKIGADPETLAGMDYEHRERGGDVVDEGERTSLSYSAISALSLCEMLYFWRYEQQLKRTSQESGEALVVGKLFHLGAEAWSRDGLDAGLAAITEEAERASMGMESRTVEQTAARCRAMLRISSEYWGGGAQ